MQAGEQGIRFLLVSGKPIEEPVAWYGPIVMNTQVELQQAVTELRNGTFIKKISGLLHASTIWLYERYLRANAHASTRWMIER